MAAFEYVAATVIVKDGPVERLEDATKAVITVDQYCPPERIAQMDLTEGKPPLFVGYILPGFQTVSFNFEKIKIALRKSLGQSPEKSAQVIIDSVARPTLRLATCLD